MVVDGVDMVIHCLLLIGATVTALGALVGMWLWFGALAGLADTILDWWLDQ